VTSVDGRVGLPCPKPELTREPPENATGWVLGGPGHREMKDLKAKVRRLEEDNEILRRASIFFAGELDPRSR